MWAQKKVWRSQYNPNHAFSFRLLNVKLAQIWGINIFCFILNSISIVKDNLYPKIFNQNHFVTQHGRKLKGS